MKVKIGPYRNWIGPYQIAQKLMFWKDEDDDSVHNFGEWLSNTFINDICQWVDARKTRKTLVKYDKYDTWNLDHTLALIILPGLKQLKETNHGYPNAVSNEDLPTACLKDASGEERWEWIMDEMIWAFEEIVNNYPGSEVFSSGVSDFVWTKKDGYSNLNKGPNHTFSIDFEGLKGYNERIQRALILFGKYYRSLWD